MKAVMNDIFIWVSPEVGWDWGGFRSWISSRKRNEFKNEDS